MRKQTTKLVPSIAKIGRHLEKFCQILDDLPLNFKFKLENTSGYFDGSWEKIPSQRGVAWQNGSRILFNSAFYPFKKRVFEAIEKEGFPLRETYFPKMRGKIISSLTKDRIEELYHKQNKSLDDIAKEYGCTKQWILLIMDKYGLKRRTRSEARKGKI